jgi:RNA polymerase sigma-70 factor (TIGR02943 family)
MPAPSNASEPEAWIEKHGDILFRFALARLRDAEAAEDVVQETFLAAMRARSEFAGKSSERSWLVGILKHKIADHYRKQVRLASVADPEALDDEVEDWFNDRGEWKSRVQNWKADPKATLADKQFLNVLDDCLSKLPPRLARAFTLREMDELVSREICEILDITATNLYAMLHRARSRLRRCLEMNWFGKA